MANKKIVYIIVEGPSDELVLGSLFEELYDNQNVFVEVMHCDILTDYLNNNRVMHSQRNANIKNELTNVIKVYAEKNHFKKEHFLKVIHICDTDGCFAPDDCIVEEDTLSEVNYSTNEIRCSNKNSLLKYRDLKRKNINILVNTNQIWSSIPYQLCFMSSSIDHVLYDKLNSSDEEKNDNARRFIKHYQNNWNECKEYLTKSSFVVPGDYFSTWEYIKKDNNSLKRNTNINHSFPINIKDDNGNNKIS